jgi:hypothetical protein
MSYQVCHASRKSRQTSHFRSKAYCSRIKRGKSHESWDTGTKVSGGCVTHFREGSKKWRTTESQNDNVGLFRHATRLESLRSGINYYVHIGMGAVVYVRRPTWYSHVRHVVHLKTQLIKSIARGHWKERSYCRFSHHHICFQLINCLSNCDLD